MYDLRGRLFARVSLTLVFIACGGGDSTTAPPPPPSVVTVDVTPNSNTIEVGRTLQLGAVARDAQGNALARQISWSTSNAPVATVSTSGMVSAVAAGGPVQITATADGKSGSAAITVILNIARVALNKSTLTFNLLGAKDTLIATAYDDANAAVPGATFTWSSSNATVVTVDATGIATSVGVGTAQISATARDKSASASVTVQNSFLETVVCNGGTPLVALLVDVQVRASIQANLTRFANDICADGYRVWLAGSVPATAPEVRAYLADVMTRSAQSLTGALLIGNFPRAYQYVVLHSTNPNIPDAKEEAISLQYYSDLNGSFTASSGYVSAGNRPYSYDVHTGNLNWEIWVGVLPLYKGNVAQSITALNRYFDKNHAYRTGGPKAPRAFLNVNELNGATNTAEHTALLQGMQTGQFAWMPFSNSAGAQHYFNSTSTGLTVQQGYSALANGTADFTAVSSHGFWGAGGQLTIAAVESTPVRTIFYWSSGCAIGDLDHADNFLTSILYSPTSEVLVAKGTTNNSGGMGTNQNGFYGRNVATAMSSGSSFGAAVVSHVNAPLIFPWSNDREFYFGTPIILGDPTLRLRSP